MFKPWKLLVKREFSFPRLIVVPLSCHEVDGVRKEKERLTAALNRGSFLSLLRAPGSGAVSLFLFLPFFSLAISFSSPTFHPSQASNHWAGMRKEKEKV